MLRLADGAVGPVQPQHLHQVVGELPLGVHRIAAAPEQLADVTAEQFYRAVNKAQPSLIRTEADELTYCLHVMVRYEIEKRQVPLIVVGGDPHVLVVELQGVGVLRLPDGAVGSCP